jgi:hypothetical protein
VDLFQHDPATDPLTYPGRIPGTSGVLVDGAYIPMRPEGGEWRLVTTPEPLAASPGALAPTGALTTAQVLAGDPTLAGLLRQLGRAPMESRGPVVAVGSNAAPSQLRRKFLDRPGPVVVPMTLADVQGIAPGVSAHVSIWGYLPATPIPTPGEISRLFVLWLDDDELAALDRTEPNYDRILLPQPDHPVTLENGARLPQCWIYHGRHGFLNDRAGTPRRLTDQRTLITSLLDEHARLRELCGDDADDFIVRTRKEAVRDTIRDLFRTQRNGGGTPV